MPQICLAAVFFALVFAAIPALAAVNLAQNPSLEIEK